MCEDTREEINMIIIKYLCKGKFAKMHNLTS